MDQVLSVVLVILVGVVAGTLSGLLGIGSGILVVPLLILLWHKEPRQAVGTALALMVFLSIAGTIRHHVSFHTVDWRMALAFAAGGVLGAYFIGAPLCNALPAKVLTRIFGVFLLLVGLKMIGLFDRLAEVWKTAR